MRALSFVLSILFVLPSFAEEKYLARKAFKPTDHVENLEPGEILLTQQPLVLMRGVPTVGESLRDDDAALSLFRMRMENGCEMWTRRTSKTARQVIGKGVRWKVMDVDSIYREEKVKTEDYEENGRPIKVAQVRTLTNHRFKFVSTNLNPQRELNMICPLNVKLESLPQFRAFAARVKTETVRPEIKSAQPIQTSAAGRE